MNYSCLSMSLICARVNIAPNFGRMQFEPESTRLLTALVIYIVQFKVNGKLRRVQNGTSSAQKITLFLHLRPFEDCR